MLGAGALQLLGQLAGECGLTGTLQTGHQYHGRLALDVQRRGVATHQGGKLVVNYLHHQLLGLQLVDHVLTQGLLLHGVGEGLGHLIVDVGVQQRAAHILQRLGDVDLRDSSFSLKYLE